VATVGSAQLIEQLDEQLVVLAFSPHPNETDLDALNGELVGVVRETMQPAHVSLWLRPDTSPKGKPAD
jgi:hypothetical protein